MFIYFTPKFRLYYYLPCILIKVLYISCNKTLFIGYVCPVYFDFYHGNLNTIVSIQYYDKVTNILQLMIC